MKFFCRHDAIGFNPYTQSFILYYKTLTTIYMYVYICLYVYIYILYMLYILHTYIYYTYICIPSFWKLTTNATDVISHCFSERRSIFNALVVEALQCFWLFHNLHRCSFPWVELDNVIWFSLCSDLALFRGCQLHVARLQIVLPFRSSFPSKHMRAWSVII